MFITRKAKMINKQKIKYQIILNVRDNQNTNPKRNVEKKKEATFIEIR